MMTDVSFIVQGGDFFASPECGASASTATITLRSDRKAGFLLTKCLRHCPNDNGLPDGLLGPPSLPTPKNDGSGAAVPARTAKDETKWVPVDLAWPVSEVCRVHGNVLQLYGGHNLAYISSTDSTSDAKTTIAAAAEASAIQQLQQSESWLDAQMPTRTECWQCDAASCDEMVARQRAAGAFYSPKVGRALLAADRRKFCRFPDLAYADAPQTMGSGWSISAPHLHANALQVLAPLLCPGANCLDVGCGSGLIACAMAWLANGETFTHKQHDRDEMDSTSGNKDSSDNASSRNGSSTGSKSSSTSSASDISRRNANSTEETSPDQSDLPWRCLGVDCEPAAITFATRVATELCPDILHANKGDYLSMEGVNQPLPETLISASFIKEGSVRSKAAQSTAAYDSNSKKGESTFHRPCGLEFAVADGWNSALYEEARFDAIHVGAAADEVPLPLLRALAPGGRMVIAVQGALFCIDRAAPSRHDLPHIDGGGSESFNGGHSKDEATAAAVPIRADRSSYGERLDLPSGYTAALVYEGAGFTPLHRRG